MTTAVSAAQGNGVADGAVLRSVTETTGPTIVELLIKAMRQVRAVKKRRTEKGLPYEFRGIDDVINAVNPVFKQLGILVVPIVMGTQYRDVSTVKGNPQREVTATVVFRFYGPSGDHLDATVASEALDSSDKGTAKAMSVALRTALIQVLLLPTKDLHPEPDEEAVQRGRTINPTEAAALRESGQPTRQELMATVLTVSEEVRQLRGESEYAAADKLVKYCQDKLGVNVIKTQNEDGAVEEVDLTKLKDAQLLLLQNVMTKALRDLRSAGQVV